jgi:hemoglobin
MSKTMFDEKLAMLPKISPKFLEEIGGAEGMKVFMDKFYDSVFESDIANFFPQDPELFEEVKMKNTNFFIQICGGEPVYQDPDTDLGQYMVDFHKDFSINDKARFEWLGVMKNTMEKHTNLSEESKQSFWDYMEFLSKMMVNVKPQVDHSNGREW